MPTPPEKPRARQHQLTAADRVAQQLRDDIDRGTLRPGQKLPSERELAEQLQVSRRTTRTAIRRLTAEGVLVSRSRVGTYVAGPSGKHLRITPGKLPSITVDRPTTADGERLANVISARDMQALMTAKELDGITVTERIRALIAIWRDVPEVGNLVDRIAKPTSRSQQGDAGHG